MRCSTFAVRDLVTTGLEGRRLEAEIVVLGDFVDGAVERSIVEAIFLFLAKPEAGEDGVFAAFVDDDEEVVAAGVRGLRVLCDILEGGVLGVVVVSDRRKC